MRKEDNLTASTPIPDLLPYAQRSRFSFLLSEKKCQPDASDEDSHSDTDTNATSECSHSSLELPTCISVKEDQCDDFLEAHGPVAQVIESVMFLQVRCVKVFL